MNYELDPGAEQRTLLASERNQLAAERTFLSWLRTGIACIGGGIAFDRLFAFETPAHQMIAYFVGFVLILLGAGIFVGSYLEYEKAYRIFKEWNPEASLSMGWKKGVVIVLFIISFIFLYLIT